MNLEPFLDELVKLGTISADDARRSMDRLDSLEKSKPNMGQIARYGALGATAGALTKGIGHAIEHGRLPTGRAAIGSAIGGAIGMGAMPLVRHHLDRRAEMGKLREFVREPKQAFAVSQYSGPLSYGPFKMTSGMPPFSAPGLGAGFQKKQDALATVKTGGIFSLPSKEEREQLGHENKRDALGVAATVGALAPIGLATGAAKRLVGADVVYHGTAPSNVARIRQNGLDPAWSGSGASEWSDIQGYKDQVKNRVHVSKQYSPTELYARIGGATEGLKEPNMLELSSMNGPGKGKVLRAGVPFQDLASNFEQDPDAGEHALRSKPGIGIPASQIGQEGEGYFKTLLRGKPKNWGGYLRAHPGRIAAGVGMAAAVPASLYGAYRAGKGALEEHRKAKGLAKVSTMLQRGLSPKSMLASSQTVGEAKLTDPTGPSIADLSKPIGYGSKLPGAIKGSL